MTPQQLALAGVVLSLLFFVYVLPALIPLFPKAFRFIGILKRLLPKGYEPGRIELGEIVLTDKDRVRHTHIVGATGSGKTFLMESLIYEDLRQGRGALIIDPKGDRDLFERIQRYCKKIGRESDLHLLSACYREESVRWNPCRMGSPAEVQSKLLNSCTFSEPFYEKACESALLNAVNEAARSGDSFHLPNLVSELKKQQNKNVEALYFDFNNLVSSEWGEVLCAIPKSKTLREISLLDITRKNEILFVDLPTEGKSVESSKIGKLLLQEIILISGLRKTFPSLRSNVPFSIYVDEFDVFATESFAIFQNKARSSNFMIHTAHQTLSDLKDVSPTFMGKILGNTNVRFVFRQDDPDDAEKWANFFGTELVVKRTFRTTGGTETGEASNRISKEFRVHPDTIKELGVGECIFSVKSSKRLARVIVPLPKQKVEKRPTERAAKDYVAPLNKTTFEGDQ